MLNRLSFRKILEDVDKRLAAMQTDIKASALPANATGTMASIPKVSPDRLTHNYHNFERTPFGILNMRMSWPEQEKFNHAVVGVYGRLTISSVAEIAGGYAVFCVIDSKPITFTDEGLFPSDTLITKLKMAAQQ